MSCPNCDHTMQLICQQPQPTYWCPRCGGLKTGERFTCSRLNHAAQQFAIACCQGVEEEQGAALFRDMTECCGIEMVEEEDGGS